MKQKHNPDNRDDNVEHIQKNINFTIRNMEAADEMMAETSNSKTKHELDEKNKRRERALDGMRQEIRDEAQHRQRDS